MPNCADIFYGWPLNSFRGNIFSLKDPTPDPTIFYTSKQTKRQTKISKSKIFAFKLNQNFVNEIRNDEENINNEIFKEYFGYQNP